MDEVEAGWMLELGPDRGRDVDVGVGTVGRLSRDSIWFRLC